MSTERQVRTRMPGLTRRALNLIATAAACWVVGGVLAAAATGSARAVRQCASAQLRLGFYAAGGTYEGLLDVEYGFQNVGAAKCSLRGFPRIVLMTKHGHAIQSETVTPDASLGPVVRKAIRPGRWAYFTVEVAFCYSHVFAFYGLRAFPPGNARGFQSRFSANNKIVSSIVGYGSGYRSGYLSSVCDGGVQVTPMGVVYGPPFYPGS
jgi:hypothetical protein